MHINNSVYAMNVTEYIPTPMGKLKSEMNFFITNTGMSKEKKSRIPVENQKFAIRFRLIDGGYMKYS